VFIASIKDIPKILELAEREGIEARASDIENFARKSRVLLLRHTKSGINIDISLGVLSFEQEMVERGIEYNAGPLTVKLPTPEDLIILKAIAHRPKDLLDIGEIAANNSDLDRKRIEYWVKSFAEILESPDLWNEVRRIIDSRE
jgi:predicted nucleotidyltransferase